MVLDRRPDLKCGRFNRHIRIACCYYCEDKWPSIIGLIQISSCHHHQGRSARGPKPYQSGRGAINNSIVLIGFERHADETLSVSEIADKSRKKLAAALLFARSRWNILKSEMSLWKKEKIWSRFREMAGTNTCLTCRLHCRAMRTFPTKMKAIESDTVRVTAVSHMPIRAEGCCQRRLPVGLRYVILL
jgi:predicted RNA-binding protein with PUA-like domain